MPSKTEHFFAVCYGALVDTHLVWTLASDSSLVYSRVKLYGTSISHNVGRREFSEVLNWAGIITSHDLSCFECSTFISCDWKFCGKCGVFIQATGFFGKQLQFDSMQRVSYFP